MSEKRTEWLSFVGSKTDVGLSDKDRCIKTAKILLSSLKDYRDGKDGGRVASICITDVEGIIARLKG